MLSMLSKAKVWEYSWELVCLLCVLRFGPSCDSLSSLAQQQQQLEHANPCDKPVPNINKFESPFVAIQTEKDKPTAFIDDLYRVASFNYYNTKEN